MELFSSCFVTDPIVHLIVKPANITLVKMNALSNKWVFSVQNKVLFIGYGNLMTTFKLKLMLIFRDVSLFY